MMMKNRNKKHINKILILVYIFIFLFIFIASGNSKIFGNTEENKITNDTQPPQIYGVVEQCYCTEHEIDPLDMVFAYDESGCECEVIGEIENVPGEYPITYKATDKAGNITEKETVVTVIEDYYETTAEDLKEITTQILDVIITADMNNYEKCRAVYDYLHNISYTGIVYDMDCIDTAYQMLAYRSGDCFGYFSAAKTLLEALGFKVLKVENDNGFTHTWCLVSVDKGKHWYHFDPTVWSWDNSEDLCMITDDELSEYSLRHLTGGVCPSHEWNTENYPETPKTAMRENIPKKEKIVF